MLRTIFGKAEGNSDPNAMASPTTIDSTAFKEALGRYPALLKDFSKPPKEGKLSLEELDKFRYEFAPSSFSKTTGRIMGLDDLLKLLDWKMTHGTFRPTLGPLIRKNSDEQIAAATKDGFGHYAAHPTDIKGVLSKLSDPLKGVGPATASLLLAIHDPAHIIYFSDELYRWLLHGGEKKTPKYSAPEFDELLAKAKSVMARLKCTPIELEKVAFTIIKENEPVYEPAPKKLPSGKPRGRPSKPDSEKKVRVPSGKPRGRPANPNRVAKAPSGLPRGRPAKSKTDEATVKPAARKAAGRPKKEEAAAVTPVKKSARAIATPKSRSAGRPKAASATKSATATGEAKKRGRPAKAKAEAEDTPATPASKKRARTSTAASSGGRSAKKAKI